MSRFKKEDSGSSGFTGTTRATYKEVADKIIEKNDNWPAATRVVFQTNEGERASLAVPHNVTKTEILRPWFLNSFPQEKIPSRHDDLKEWLERNMPKGELWVYSKSGFIRSRLAPPGKHLFTLSEMWKWSYENGQNRLSFGLRTDQYLSVTWHVPYPTYEATKGQSPAEDKFLIPRENEHAWRYLEALGLDWDKLELDIDSAPAVWDGHFDNEGKPIPPLFPDEDNIAPQLLSAVVRHNTDQAGTYHPKLVRLNIIDDPNYGLGAERDSNFFVKLTEVVRDEPPWDEPAGEFSGEVTRFMESWDSLTKKVNGREDAIFMDNMKLTDEGRFAALSVLKPVMNEFPNYLKKRKEDGSPLLWLPPTPETWTLDGVVCASYLAERLLEAEAGDGGAIFEIVDQARPEKVVSWAKANVPELEGPEGDAL